MEKDEGNRKEVLSWGCIGERVNDGGMVGEGKGGAGQGYIHPPTHPHTHATLHLHCPLAATATTFNDFPKICK